MSRIELSITHHLASGCCMWSGIEDVYTTQTGQTVPEAFLLGLSSFGESVFVKTRDPKKPYLFSIVDGRTRKTYDRIKEALGLHYQISEGRSLQYALSSIYKEIDKGNPVLLGPLDMYHLPYLKMYHRFHIPMHYIMMVGYDDEKDCILIYDCDRIELIELPKEELLLAWQVPKTVVGNKNGFIRFHLDMPLPDKYELAYTCLKAKADRQLVSKLSFVGVNAFLKFAKEFPGWKDRYSESEYRNILASLTESFCMVPKLPNEITGDNTEDTFPFRANYDRFATMLIDLGKEYKNMNWEQAGKLFIECGKHIEKVTEIIVAFYCRGEDECSRIPKLFTELEGYARTAYEYIKKEE